MINGDVGGKRVLIVGGMGAFASADFHVKLLNALVLSSGKSGLRDDEFPEILHYSISLPDENFSGDFPLAGSGQVDRVNRVIAEFIPDVIVIACFSATERTVSCLRYPESTRLVTVDEIPDTIVSPVIIAAESAVREKSFGDRLEYQRGPGIEGLAVRGYASAADLVRLHLTLDRVIQDGKTPVLACTEYGLLERRFVDGWGEGVVVLLTDVLVDKVVEELSCRVAPKSCQNGCKRCKGPGQEVSSPRERGCSSA